MTKFEILCPWCNEKREFELNLEEKAIRQELLGNQKNIDKNPLDVFPSYVINGKCDPNKCLPTFEAFVCKGLESTKIIQRMLERYAWFPPRRFNLRRPGGENFVEDYFGIVFNTKPLERWKKLQLEQFIENDIISKYLIGSAFQNGVHATLFEACPVGEKIFWAPINPNLKQISLDLNIKLRNRDCLYFREKYEKNTTTTLLSVLESPFSCPYLEHCLLKPNCIFKDKGIIPENASLERCLKWLEIAETQNCCYQSDISIINNLVEKCENGQLTNDFIIEPCWKNKYELAFPVIVHDHIMAVVIFGPIESAEGSTEKYGEIVNKISLTAKHRYLHLRFFIESAFRLELSGYLTQRLIDGAGFAKFLPDLLQKIEKFWAFQRSYLLMNADWEERVTLYSSGKNYLLPIDQSLKPPITFPWNLEESGARSIFIRLGNIELSEEEQQWKRLWEEIEQCDNDSTKSLLPQVLFVLIHTGGRRYIYCLAGRDIEGCSILPRKNLMKSDLRLTQEAKEQMLRTCQIVSERLDNFWRGYDRDDSNRALGHSIRTPIALMKKGTGQLQKLVRFADKEGSEAFKALHGLDKESATYTYLKSLISASTNVIRSSNIGSVLVNSELENLSIIPDLEQRLEKASSKKTDLIEIINELKNQYIELASVAESKYKKRHWDFSIEYESAEIIGERELVRLAIMNALENANKYTFNERTIKIRLSKTDIGWELKIVNQGVPIERNEIDAIWEKNRRGIYAKRREGKSEEGSGLGLYLISRILRAINNVSGPPWPYSMTSTDISTLNKNIRRESEITLIMKFKEWR